jgi:hypothetical protein
MVLERKVAFINLTDDSIEIKPVPLSLRKKFLGGRGIRTSLKNSAARTGLGAVMGSKNLSKEINRYLWNHIRAERCPFKALSVVDETAYHCDLCGGDPQCIKVCTPKAISIVR